MLARLLKIKKRKHYRHPKNYLEKPYANDVWLRKHFRFDRVTILQITDIVREDLTVVTTARGLPISPEIQV
jgi:hypothetical protein